MSINRLCSASDLPTLRNTKQALDRDRAAIGEKKYSAECLHLLHLASFEGDTELVKELIYDGNLKESHLNQAKSWFLKSGKEKSVKNQFTVEKPRLLTPLLLAMYGNHPDTIKALVNHKANVNYTFKRPPTSPFEALQYKSWKGEIIRAESHPLYHVQEDDKIINADTVQALLESKATFGSVSGTSELLPHDFIRQRHDLIETIVKHYVKIGQGNPLTMNTLLLEAIKNAPVKMEGIKILIDHKADPEYKGKAPHESCRSPLYYAVYNNRADIAELLLNHKANPNSKTEIGETLLMTAVEKNHETIVKLLLEKTQEQEKDTSPPSPTDAKSENSHKNIIDLLLSHTPPINEKSKEGDTALTLALKSEEINATIVQSLLEANANPTQKDGKRNSPLLCLLKNTSIPGKKFQAILEILLKYLPQGVLNQPIKGGDTPLTLLLKDAYSFYREEKLRVLIEQCRVRVDNKDFKKVEVSHVRIDEAKETRQRIFNVLLNAQARQDQENAYRLYLASIRPTVQTTGEDEQKTSALMRVFGNYFKSQKKRSAFDVLRDHNTSGKDIFLRVCDFLRTPQNQQNQQNQEVKPAVSPS